MRNARMVFSALLLSAVAASVGTAAQRVVVCESFFYTD